MSMQAVPYTAPVAIPVNSVIVGLGNDGVPIRVISRATKLSCEDIREILHEAMDEGVIVQMPREDWLAKSTRDDRDPGLDAFEMMPPDALIYHCHRVFGTTKLQSAFLVPLIKRKEVPRDHLHAIIEQRRGLDKKETDMKMVDVVIYHVRSRLKKHNVQINTIWSIGYFISPEQRKLMRNMIVEHVTAAAP